MAKPVIFGVTPEFLAREGLTETIQPWEDGLRAETGRGSFEWWYFDAHFDSPETDARVRNSTAVIVFSTKPILERKGPLKPNVMLTITRPNGTKLSSFPIFQAGHFKASSETCDVRIGHNWVKGNLHSYHLHIEMGDPVAEAGKMAADLTFSGLVPPWRPGAGKSYFGDLDHYFAWLPAIPYGTVTGTITYDGQTYHVKGNGYHDHNWGNVGLNDVMDHWYWGRAHIGDYTLIYVEQVGAKNYGYTRMPVFMLAKGDQILTWDGSFLTMQAADFIKHAGGRSYPREVDFRWQNGAESIELSLRGSKLIEATSLLLTLPDWQQTLARLFANPYYFRFNAELILSLHLGGQHITEHGPALFEIMILQGKKHP